MLKLKEYAMTAAHKHALSNAHHGKHQSSDTKRKIAKAMVGKANHTQKHGKIAKERISASRGHYDPIKGKKWIVTRANGKTYRKKGLPDTARYQYGRHVKTFKEWVSVPHINTSDKIELD